jgi:hypothetical protein
MINGKVVLVDGVASLGDHEFQAFIVNARKVHPIFTIPNSAHQMSL